MGKLKKRSKLSQQRRKQQQLANKNGKTTSNEAKEEQKLAPLIAKLSAAAANDRSMALSSIILLSDNDPNARKILLKNELVKILLTKLIHDENDEIVVEAYGLLRNLIIEEGYDLSVHLWRSDIWTSLESGFKKAVASVDHINDSSVDATSKGLLVDYIDNLISCLGSLSTEVSIQLFDEQILPKLQESGILKFVFELIDKKVSNKLTLTSLEFLYDLSTLSLHFIELFANEESAIALISSIDYTYLNTLSQVYLIGLKFQIMEYKGELIEAKSDSILIDSILLRLDSILKDKVDIKATVDQLNAPLETNPGKEQELLLRKAKNNFKLIDLVLDLYTTIIEIKGEQQVVAPRSMSKTTKERLASFFLTDLVSFLSDLITTGFKNAKILVCLNNLSLYLKSIEILDESYINFLKQVGTPILNDFNSGLKAEEINLETVTDELNFLINYLEFTQEEQITVDQEQLARLIKLSSFLTLEKYEVNQLTQFSTGLITYFTIMAKSCNSIEITKEISKFIVDEKILAPINVYKSFKNASELHKKYKFLVEYTLVESINSIFELFDDDYPYNKPIFHDGGLLDVLKNSYNDYKVIFKSIDKKVDVELKERSEDTLTNLGRFIEYKETEKF